MLFGWDFAFAPSYALLSAKPENKLVLKMNGHIAGYRMRQMGASIENDLAEQVPAVFLMRDPARQG